MKSFDDNRWCIVLMRQGKSANGYVVLVALLACLQIGCDESSARAENDAHSVSLSSWATRVDTIAGEYTRVIRPAEFWDSVLVIPDVGERRLWRVSLKSGDRQPFGSLGRGPGEYPRVSWALKVHADSVAIVQGASFVPFPVISVANGRGRTLRFESAPAEAANIVAAMAQSTRLHYSDTLGHLYGSPAWTTPADASTGSSDVKSMSPPGTVPLLRFSLRSNDIDTVGFVPTELPSSDMQQRDSRSSRRRLDLGPYAHYSSWRTLADGRSVSVSGRTYTIKTLDRSGKTEEWSIEHPRIPVSKRDFEKYLDSSRRMSDNLLTTTFARAGVTRAPPVEAFEVPRMPDELPALNFAGVRGIHGSGNILWLPVHVEDPPSREVWDLVDTEQRKRICRVAFEKEQRLLLVTANGAYVATQDPMGLERLARYQRDGFPCADGGM